MAYGAILGQTPAPPASNVSYNNSGTSGTISSTNVQGALDNIVTKTNSLQSQINATNSNLTSNVNNLQGQINSLSSQIGSGLKANLVVNQTYTSYIQNQAIGKISFDTTNVIGCFAKVSGSYTWNVPQDSFSYYDLSNIVFFNPDSNPSISSNPGASAFYFPFTFYFNNSPTVGNNFISFNNSISMIRTFDHTLNTTFSIGNVYNSSQYLVGALSSENSLVGDGTFSFYLVLRGNYSSSSSHSPPTISNININLKLYTITI